MGRRKASKTTRLTARPQSYLLRDVARALKGFPVHSDLELNRTELLLSAVGQRNTSKMTRFTARLRSYLLRDGVGARKGFPVRVDLKPS